MKQFLRKTGQKCVEYVAPCDQYSIMHGMSTDALTLLEPELGRGSILAVKSRHIGSRLLLLSSTFEKVNASTEYAVDIASRNGQISTVRISGPGILTFEHVYNTKRETIVVVVTGTGERLAVAMSRVGSAPAPKSLLEKVRGISSSTWERALSAAMNKVPRQFLTQNVVGVSTTVAVCAAAVAPVCIGSAGKLVSSFAIDLIVGVLNELSLLRVLTQSEASLLINVIKDAKLLNSVLSVASVVDVAKVVAEVSIKEPSENTEVLMQIAGDSVDKFSILISIAKGKVR